jgi:hypothetical protein
MVLGSVRNGAAAQRPLSALALPCFNTYKGVESGHATVGNAHRPSFHFDRHGVGLVHRQRIYDC